MGTIRIKNNTEPSTPSSGYFEVYVDSVTNHLTMKNAAGSVIDVHNRSNHTGTQTASTISDFSSAVAGTASVSAATAHITSNGTDHSYINQSVTSTATPTFSQVTLSNSPSNATDAVRKDYVDGLIQNVKRKDNCEVATTGNITLSGEQTIDGVLTSSDRVLVWQQTDPKENGIYVSSSGAWSRSVDGDDGVELLGALVLILSGSTYGGSQFNNSNTSITIGVTNITFVSLGSTILHNSTLGLQGGSINSYYHLTQTQHTDLTDAGDSTLHYHAADRDRANHTGTQTASTISDFDTEVSNNTDVAANTAHRTNNGTDHSYINQSVTTSASPYFASVGVGITPTIKLHVKGADTSANTWSIRLQDSADATVFQVDNQGNIEGRKFTGQLGVLTTSTTSPYYTSSDMLTGYTTIGSAPGSQTSSNLYLYGKNHNAGYGSFTLGSYTHTTDQVAGGSTIKGVSAWASASTNKNGGDVTINGGDAASGGTDGGVIIGSKTTITKNLANAAIVNVNVTNASTLSTTVGIRSTLSGGQDERSFEAKSSGGSNTDFYVNGRGIMFVRNHATIGSLSILNFDANTYAIVPYSNILNIQSTYTSGFKNMAFQNAMHDKDAKIRWATTAFTTYTSPSGATFDVELSRSSTSDMVVTVPSTSSLDVAGNRVRVRTSKTPASATDTGNQGEICWDSDYLYVCTSANVWKRAALSTW